MKQEMKLFNLSFLYDVDIDNDTYTLLYPDHKEVVHGIPLVLLNFFHSGLIGIGCICVKNAKNKGGE